MRLIAFACLCLLLINASAVCILNSEASSFESLSEGFSWTYNTDMQRLSKSKTDPVLDFEYGEALEGNVTITNLSESIISLEDRFTVKRYRVAATGDIWNPELYSFTFKDDIDRTTLTYTRTILENMNGSEETIEADFGEPAREFISTSLKERQQVEYNTVFVSRALCSVIYDEFEFQDSIIQVVLLTYSGPSDRSEEPDTNGFAECNYVFEKTTGLMIWAIESEEAENAESVDTSTYFFQVDQISSMPVERTTTIPQPTPPKEAPSKAPITPSWNTQDFNFSQDLKIDPILIALVIIMIVIVASLVLTLIFLKKGKRTSLENDQKENSSVIDTLEN
ncbi:MAG: hypothetical protein WBF08_10605 [Candidatus Bathyarchaeia archaeon]